MQHCNIASIGVPAKRMAGKSHAFTTGIKLPQDGKVFNPFRKNLMLFLARREFPLKFVIVKIVFIYNEYMRSLNSDIRPGCNRIN